MPATPEAQPATPPPTTPEATTPRPTGRLLARPLLVRRRNSSGRDAPPQPLAPRPRPPAHPAPRPQRLRRRPHHLPKQPPAPRRPRPRRPRPRRPRHRCDRSRAIRTNQNPSTTLNLAEAPKTKKPLSTPVSTDALAMDCLAGSRPGYRPGHGQHAGQRGGRRTRPQRALGRRRRTSPAASCSRAAAPWAIWPGKCSAARRNRSRWSNRWPRGSSPISNCARPCSATFLRKAQRRSWRPRPRVLIAVPGCATPVEKRAVFNSAGRAGARIVYVISEAKASAIGAGLPIAEPIASMICDIGGGTTDVAILSLGEIVASQSIRVAGDAMDRAVVDYLRRNYSLRVGLPAAETLRIAVGSAYPLEEELVEEVRGIDAVSGLPRKAILTSEEVREALWRPAGSYCRRDPPDARRLPRRAGGRPGRLGPGAGRRRSAVAGFGAIYRGADRHSHPRGWRSLDHLRSRHADLFGTSRQVAFGARVERRRRVSHGNRSANL